MPNMDGFEATRLIRDPLTGVKNPHVVIIAMTANAMQGDREECLTVGMNDYVSKPISMQNLVNTLDRWLPEENVPIFAPESGEGDVHVPLVPTDAELSVFNRKDMKARLLDDDAIVAAVVEEFLNDMPRQLRAVRDFLESGDRKGLSRQLHTIKGTSAHLSAEALREAAASMEQALNEGRIDLLAAMARRLETTFERTREIMEKL
jgi:HPt (histidine-containing phosphotransfer) domain-containing protein